MEIFGLVMCFVILLTAQHLGNWAIREAKTNNEPAAIFVAILLMSIFSFAISWIIVDYLQNNKL